MKSEHENTSDSERLQLLLYAGPRQPDEELPMRARRFFIGNRVSDVIVVVAIIAPLIAVLLPSRTRRGYSPVVACQSNMRQISIAMEHYAADNQGVFPPTLADVVKYVGGNAGKCFVCPESSTKHSPGPTTAQLAADLSNPTKACCSYVLVVPGMTQRGMKRDTILFHELPGNHKNAMTNFAYADGSVRSLTPAEAKWALSELNAGCNPPPPIGLRPTTASSR